MNEKKANKDIENITVQDYLSIGYVFLLILGVFHETIYYKFIGVNILEYSSVLDVLISPISVIIGNLYLGLAVVVCVGIGIGYTKLLPIYYKWLGKKKKYQAGKNKEKLEQTSAKIKSKNFAVVMIVLYVFSMFIGLGVGRGSKTLSRIEEGDIKPTHELTFEDGGQHKIKMLGKNSLNVFYIIIGETEVSISPIEGNIKVIKKLKKEEKESVN